VLLVTGGEAGGESVAAKGFDSGLPSNSSLLIGSGARVAADGVRAGKLLVVCGRSIAAEGIGGGMLPLVGGQSVATGGLGASVLRFTGGKSIGDVGNIAGNGWLGSSAIAPVVAGFAVGGAGLWLLISAAFGAIEGNRAVPTAGALAATPGGEFGADATIRPSGLVIVAALVVLSTAALATGFGGATTYAGGLV
jgi:hypothetical protein